MKEFISKWSNWWILAPKRKQLDDAFEKELNELIEREVALHITAGYKTSSGLNSTNFQILTNEYRNHKRTEYH